jgi:hypothetical protein
MRRFFIVVKKEKKLNQPLEPVCESKDATGKQYISINGLPTITNIRNLTYKSLMN